MLTLADFLAWAAADGGPLDYYTRQNGRWVRTDPPVPPTPEVPPCP